jgi:nitrate/nitrite transporter NarK
MIISRAVFGLGGENLTVTTSAFIGQWFKGKELACALGIDISAARIAASVNDIVQPRLYESFGKTLHAGYWLGFVCTCYGFMCAFIASSIDICADKADAKIKDDADKQRALTGKNDGPQEEVGEEVKLSDIFQFKLPYWLITLNCVFFYMAYFSFMNVVSKLMLVRFGIDPETAGVIMVCLLLG